MKNLVFGLIILALALVGLTIYMGEQKQDKIFAQEIADQLTVTTKVQAEALDKAQEVQLEQAKLNTMLVKEQIQELRTNRWLATVGIIALTIVTPIFLILAVMVIRVLKARFANWKGGDK